MVSSTFLLFFAAISLIWPLRAAAIIYGMIWVEALATQLIHSFHVGNPLFSCSKLFFWSKEITIKFKKKLSSKAKPRPEWFGTRFSVCMLWLLACCFLDLLTVGVEVSLTPLPALGTLFFLLVFLVQPWYEGFFHVFSHLVLSHVWLLSLGGLFFLKGNRGGMNLQVKGGGRVLGGMGERETVFGMYFIKEEYILNKK